MIYCRRDDFEILRWPFVTFNDIWGHTSVKKELRLYIVSIHRNFIKIG